MHEPGVLGLEVVCLDAGHARALKMQINKTDQNDAEGLAQIVRTGWYRYVRVRVVRSHRCVLFWAQDSSGSIVQHIRGVVGPTAYIMAAGAPL
jgi:hypothetical protein